MLLYYCIQLFDWRPPNIDFGIQDDGQHVVGEIKF